MRSLPTQSSQRVPTAQRRTASGTTILRACTLTHVGDASPPPRVVDTRDEWFALVAEEFGLTYEGVPVAATDRLWSVVLAAHRARDAPDPADGADSTVDG